MKRLVIFLLAAGLLFGAGYGTWMYFKPHQNVLKTKAAFTMSSEELVSKFSSNTEQTNQELLGEIIGISGKVTRIDDQNGIKVISIDNGGDFIIQNYLMDSEENQRLPNIGDGVIIKGRYVGVIINDEDFFIPADIKIEQCYIID